MLPAADLGMVGSVRERKGGMRSRPRLTSSRRELRTGMAGSQTEKKRWAGGKAVEENCQDLVIFA